MGAEPGAAELRRQLLGDARDRQPAGVGGENDSGLEKWGDFGEKFLLDGEILGDCFDHPIAFGKQREVMIEGSGLDQPDIGRVVKGRRLGAAEGIERGFRCAAGRLPASPAKSSSTTGMPALARCAAMRTPMVPAPSTAARLIIPGRGRAGGRPADGRGAFHAGAGAELMLIPSPLTLRFSLVSGKNRKREYGVKNPWTCSLVSTLQTIDDYRSATRKRFSGLLYPCQGPSSRRMQ